MWSSHSAAPWYWEAAGLEGALWLFLLCWDRNLLWVKLTAQSATYTHFVLLWKAPLYCSHLDLGAQTSLGQKLGAAQVLIQRVPSDKHLLLWMQEGSCFAQRFRREVSPFPSSAFPKHQQALVLPSDISRLAPESASSADL